MQGRLPAVQKLKQIITGGTGGSVLNWRYRSLQHCWIQDAAEQVHDPGGTWLKGVQYMNYRVPTAVRAEPFQLRLIFLSGSSAMMQ